MKSNRHTKIVELITKYPITTQEELLEYLKAEGFDVTQSTVSRDIKKLRLSKSLDQNGKYRYQAPQTKQSASGNGFLNIVDSSIISVEYALNMVVVKTYAGMAQAVCAAIDSMDHDAIMGTIAGDDTIFIVCKSEESARAYSNEFSGYVQ
ncbi:MAG: arginine repressor [Ruminococcaceae bacterium]|nr:arginine repressor [Oscillospiraceae bacterium]